MAAKSKPEARDTLVFQLRKILHRNVNQEVKFHPTRKWLFDIALWPVAIEINGGIWRKGGGAHTGTGHLRDMEKFNEAQLLGWKVYQFTPQQVESGEALNFLERVFKP